MTLFSANLGFLFTEYELPDAIIKAHQAGFDAVELHWPYEVEAKRVKQALTQTGLPLLSLNTITGKMMGLCAQADLKAQAHDSIAKAFTYGAAVGAQGVHVMAGIASGDAAHDCFIDNLSYACELARAHQMIVLIEALNQHDVPGYYIQDNSHAAEIIKSVGAPELRLLFDCYHIAKSGGDILAQFHQFAPLIGHIQFAGIPMRGAPDPAFYAPLFKSMTQAGWQAPFGAEYRPFGTTEDSLHWHRLLRQM